jgi:hypothetical protein
VIVCGKETMKLTDGNTDPIVIEFLRGSNEQQGFKLAKY